MNCTFHPDRPTLLRCTRCGRPACPDCLTDAPVGSHCRECVRADRQQFAAADRRNHAAQMRPGWPFFALIGAFLAVCVAAFVTPAPASYVAPGLTYRALGIAIVILGTLVSVTFHEWGHAITAFRGGDYTVRDKGYLTLDFRKYSNPLLSIGFPILFLAMGGLPLPGGAVWINNGLLRGNGWRSLVSLAGSTMNIIFGFLLGGLLATGALDAHPVLAGPLTFLVFLQFGVALINLLPIPGLDGYGVLEPFLPDGVRRGIEPIRPYGLMILILGMMTGAFGFIWDAAGALAGLVQLDPRLLSIGAQLARFR